MSNFKKLAQLNKIANEFINDGDFNSAARVHNEFMKIAQAGTGEYNGPEMQKAIVSLQNILGVQADGLFGGQTVYQIVKALDGIAPEQTLDKDYIQRARAYVQSLPAGFVGRLKNFAGMKDEIRQLQNLPPARRSEEEPSMVKVRLLQALVGYR